MKHKQSGESKAEVSICNFIFTFSSVGMLYTFTFVTIPDPTIMAQFVGKGASRRKKK